METSDGVTRLWFKTLTLKDGCALILEIEFQILKKDIKLLPQVLVKIQDQWPDQYSAWREKMLQICSEMTNTLDTVKKLELLLMIICSERRLLSIVSNILQPFVPQLLENKLLSWLLLDLMPMDAGLLIMLIHKTDSKFKVKLSEVEIQFSLDTLQLTFI